MRSRSQVRRRCPVEPLALRACPGIPGASTATAQPRSSSAILEFLSVGRTVEREAPGIFHRAVVCPAPRGQR
eukprot:11181364-Lingulodinium_polyedra.AAC.1